MGWYLAVGGAGFLVGAVLMLLAVKVGLINPAAATKRNLT